jgi:transcriptional regulator with XRE-family HTH domain
MAATQYEDFGKIVATARKRKGLEQSELARLLSTTQQNVSRWEAGRSRPRLRQLPLLALALGEREETLRAAAGYGAPAEVLPTAVTLSHDQSFPVDALPPETFQRFIEDLVRALHPDAREVRAAGKTGHDQAGADILAILADGRRSSFQCKRVTRFGPADVREVVRAHTASADHKYLVLSRVASPQTAEALRAFPDWTLWDKDDIARLVRDSLAPLLRRKLVDKYFPGQRYALLGEPNPGPWQTPEDFFAPFAGMHATFSHDWDLVGRKKEVDTIAQGLRSDTNRIVLLLGAGGSGKSRILKSVVEALQTHDKRVPLFLSPTETLDAAALEMLGRGPEIVIVDDAHDRGDLAGLFAYAAHPGRDIRILLATRPYARARLRGQAGEFARGGAITEVELARLSLADTAKLATEVLARFGGAPEFAEPIAHATRDCPLVTVLAGRIAVEENLPLSLAQNAGAFRDTILGKFAKIITGELAPPGEQKTLTDLLKLISLVQPFSVEDAAFLELATNIAGVPRDKASATLRMLIEGGILFRRGAQYRLMPDLLGDYIIEQTCIGADERLDSFADQVFAAAAPPLLGHVLVNLGRLDWRRTSGDPAKSDLVAHLWRALKVTGGYHDSALEAVTEAAIYQPRQALDFVIRQWRAGVRHDDLVKIVRNTAYHLDHLIDACGVLWEMGRADDRDQGRFPSHAIRTLQELCAVEPDKPLAFNETIVDFGLALVDRPDAFDALFSPFDFLKGVLSGEGYTTDGDNRTITFMPFTVNYDAVAPMRDRVIDRAIAILSGLSLRAAGRAATFLEDALRYPMPSFGGHIPDLVLARYTTEFRETLGRLRNLVQSDTLDPVVKVAIAHTVAWHAHYAGGETALIACKLFEELPTDLPFRLLAALSDGFGQVFLGRVDANTWQSRLNAWVADLVKDLSAAYPSVRQLRQVLEDALARTSEAGLAKDHSSHVLVHEILRTRIDLAHLVVEEASTDPEGRLSVYLDAALSQVLHTTPDEARRYARRFLDGGLIAFQRAVGRAFSNPPMNDDTLAPADAEIIKRVLSSSDSHVVSSGLRVLSTLARKSWRIAIDLLRHANLKLSTHVANQAFMMLLGFEHDIFAALDEDDVHYILGELKPLPELKGHWIETLLSHLSLHFPGPTSAFLLARVDQATASDDAFSRYRPINYGPSAQVRLRFKESPRYVAVLESVWQWMTAHDPGDWRFEHHASALFAGMFLPIDEAVLAFLSGKMATANPRSLRWIASVLGHADPNFVFDHHKMVVSFLDACERAAEPVRRKAIDALYRSATSGVRHGRPGEPFPRDLQCREASLALLARLPRLSPAYELYDMLRADADQSIAWARKEAEAFDDA